jgi:hypothetical protein
MPNACPSAAVWFLTLKCRARSTESAAVDGEPRSRAAKEGPAQSARQDTALDMTRPLDHLTRITILSAMAWLLLASTAAATSLTAFGDHRFEDHSGENHSNEFLDGIDLSGGSVVGINLRFSSLVGGTFVGTDFTNANLRNTDFTGADLTDAIFSAGANLRDADFTNAVIVGIDLTGVNVQNTIFTGAIYDATTILPFDPVAAGMTPVPELSPVLLIGFGLMGIAGASRPRPTMA